MPGPEEYVNQSQQADQSQSAVGRPAPPPTAANKTQPAIVDSLDRLRSQNTFMSEQIERLERLVNRVIFGTETMPDNNHGVAIPQPTRPGLVGAVEDIADHKGILNDRFAQLLGQISEHI